MGMKISYLSGDDTEAEFLFQRISVTTLCFCMIHSASSILTNTHPIPAVSNFYF